MISFSRNLLVGAEFVEENLIRFHGILEDSIYAMEIRLEVRIPEGIITAIQGWMKRYTTPVCPRAPEVLPRAVGMSLREEGWFSKINQEIGRQGCQHLAAILIECGRCLDQARMAHALEEALRTDPSASSLQLSRSWLEDHPEIQGSCLARLPRRGGDAG